MENILSIIFTLMAISSINSQTVYFSSNPTTTIYDRSIIIVPTRFESDCIIKIVQSPQRAAECGYWRLTTHPIEAKYKFLLTTPRSNTFIKGKKPLRIFIEKTWYYSKESACDCEHLLN